MWGKLLTVALLPAYQIWNAAAYAGTRPTWLGKALTFATFLPLIVLTPAIWGALWIVALRLAWGQLARISN